MMPKSETLRGENRVRDDGRWHSRQVSQSGPPQQRATPLFCQLRDGTRFSLTFPVGSDALQAYRKILGELQQPSGDFFGFMDDGVLRKSDVVALWIGSPYAAWTGVNECHVLDEQKA
jgi:hypothetical protein